MISEKVKYFPKSKNIVFQELINIHTLENTFFRKIIKIISSMDAFVTIRLTHKIADDVVMGEIEPSDKIKTTFPKMFFQIHLETTNNLQTKVILITSDDPFTFTPEYKKQVQKLTRNNYRYATIAAVALVALLIPAGVFAGDGIAADLGIIPSEAEGFNHLAGQAITNGNYQDGRYYAGQALQQQSSSEPIDRINAFLHLRETYPHTQPHSSAFSTKNSLITIESSSDIVMFYPEKDKTGYVIPRHNAEDSLSPFILDYPGDVPIVYPINGQYPTIIFDMLDPTAFPIIVGPDDPNRPDLLSTDNLRDRIMVQPPYKTDKDIKINKYAETFFGGPNDPVAIHPYGFGDVPVIVFPDQESAAVVLRDSKSGDGDDKPNQDRSQDISGLVYIMDEAQAETTDGSIVPVQYVTVSPEDLDDIPGNIPVRVFVDGPDHPPVDFPLGTDFRPVIDPTYVPDPNDDAGAMISPPLSDYQDSDGSTNHDDQDRFTESTVSDGSAGFHVPDGSYGSAPSWSDGSAGSYGPAPNPYGTTIVYGDGAGMNGYDSIIEVGGYAENDQSSPSDETLDPEISEPILIDPFSEDMYAMLDLVQYGDPIAFSIGGDEEENEGDSGACTMRREMGSHDSTYWNINLYSSNPPIMLNLDRNLCEGTYIIGIDRNGNGALDSGYEIMWLPGYDAFQILHNIDYYEGVYDGVFDTSDPLWTDALVMDSDYNYYHPEDLGIKAVDYHGSDIQRFADDQHGIGVYADEVNVSDIHFRILAHAPTAIVLDDGSTVEAFGLVEGPLWDCTIHDVRYHVAEKMTGQYLRTENPEDSTQLYVDALDFCGDFEAVHQNPDKYLSHWVAGIASMQHKKGLSDPGMLLQSKLMYEEALAMSPDNPFYNSDYCLVNHQLGMSTDECIPKVAQAIVDRPDVGWFQDVYRILVR